VIIDSYRRNLDLFAEMAQIGRRNFTAALQRQQEIVHDTLEQMAIERGGDAQQDVRRKALERRLAALRNFAEITDVSNQEFFDAAYRRMTGWCDEISRSLLDMEGGISEQPR
jgi:hypothetical protein